MIQGLSDVIAIDAGAEGVHNVAITRNREVWQWGRNWDGQLGDNRRISRHTPERVHNISQVTNVAAGGDFVVAQSGGRVWAWGRNVSGQLGIDSTDLRRLTPVQISTPANVNMAFVAAGSRHAFAVLSGGIAWGWGNNGAGHIGDGTSIERRGPVLVQELW